MVSDYREIPQQGSPHIPPSAGYGYFTEQGRVGPYPFSNFGYMGPDPGRTLGQEFRSDHHQQSLHPHPHHPLPFLLPHSHDNMHEAIQREIEKERIREEIIMSEIVRRRVLEAEVRRELMMERELAIRRGSNPFGSPSVMGFDSPMRLPLVETRAEARSLEERIVLSLAERDRLNGRHESGGFETLPYQRGSADVRISEVKPVLEGGKEKEKIILLAKPNETISGSKRDVSKREAVMSVSGVDASEIPPDGNLKKKAKEEWSCALCQVSATSERGLKEHLQGKKHKSKEAALRAQKAGKNYSIGLFPKKAAKSIQGPGTVDPGTDNEVKFTSESLPFHKTGEASSKTDDLPLLQENLNSDNLNKSESVAAQKVQKNGDPKKKNYRFWCEMCQVGAPSQRTMNHHKRGKKHMHRLCNSNQNSGAGPSDPREEKKSVKHAVKPEEPKPVDETKAEDGGTVDITNPDDDLTKPDVADELKVGELTVQTKAEDCETVDITNPDDDLAKPDVADELKDDDLTVETKAKDREIVDITNPDDDLAKPDVADELSVETKAEDCEAMDVTNPDDDWTKPDVADELTVETKAKDCEAMDVPNPDDDLTKPGVADELIDDELTVETKEEDCETVIITNPDDDLAKPDVADELKDDKLIIETKGEDCETVNVSNPDDDLTKTDVADELKDDKLSVETKAENCEAVDISNPDDDLTKPDTADEPKEGELTVSRVQPLGCESNYMNTM